MTELDRLRDDVIDIVRLHIRTGLLSKDGPAAKALAALDAHPAPRATAETVRVAVWKQHNGSVLFAQAGSRADHPDTFALRWTRLGTTTLRLDTEAEG